MNRSLRRLVLGAASGSALLVVTASLAYACVELRGDITVTGNDKNGEKITGFSNGSSHLFCNTATGTSTGVFVPGSVYAAATEGNTITVTVSPSDGNCPTSPGAKLNAGNHSVIINNAKSAQAVPFTSVTNGSGSWSFTNGRGCFAGPTGNITLTTAFSVTSAGNGASVGSWTLPNMNRTDGTNEASLLCVGNSIDADGIFSPIRITAV